MGPRDVLNKLKWHPEFKLKDAEITIIHRGAPRNRRTFKGKEIVNLGSGFMEVQGEETMIKIPYHRITKIERGKEVLWKEKR